LFGDPARNGKPLARDLTSGKRTLLLRLALKRAKAAELKALRRVLGNPAAKLPALRAALAAMQATGAPELVERRIDELTQLALAELGRGVGSSGRALLVGATAALASRRS
jgi:geranylgeranyl diphosphate synthase type I